MKSPTSMGLKSPSNIFRWLNVYFSDRSLQLTMSNPSRITFSSSSPPSQRGDQIPWDPRDIWYICRHENHKNQRKNLGKYTSPMDPMGLAELRRQTSFELWMFDGLHGIHHFDNHHHLGEYVWNLSQASNKQSQVIMDPFGRVDIIHHPKKLALKRPKPDSFRKKSTFTPETLR